MLPSARPCVSALKLAADGWAVLVGGRDLAKAERFAAELPGARSNLRRRFELVVANEARGRLGFDLGKLDDFFLLSFAGTLALLAGAWAWTKLGRAEDPAFTEEAEQLTVQREAAAEQEQHVPGHAPEVGTVEQAVDDVLTRRLRLTTNSIQVADRLAPQVAQALATRGL